MYATSNQILLCSNKRPINVGPYILIRHSNTNKSFHLQQNKNIKFFFLKLHANQKY